MNYYPFQKCLIDENFNKLNTLSLPKTLKVKYLENDA